MDRESIASGIPYRSKYEILEDVVSAMGADRNSVLLANSWDPKGEILEFVNGNGNVAGIFTIPINGWYDQLGGASSPLADAILDRIVHSSYQINREPLDPSKDFSMLEVYGSIKR